MNFENFKKDFDARLAAMSDDELNSRLEHAGCLLADPWMADFFDEEEVIIDEDGFFFASSPNSSVLALAA